MEIIKKIFEVVALFPQLVWYKQMAISVFVLSGVYVSYLVFGGHLVAPGVPSMSNQELRKEALETSQQILEFVAER